MTDTDAGSDAEMQILHLLPHTCGGKNAGIASLHPSRSQRYEGQTGLCIRTEGQEDARVGSELVTVVWEGREVTYPRATPMVRGEWVEPEAAPTVPHPAPEVLCRPARHEEMPRTAQSLLGAFRAPWTATATYARGTTLGRLGKVVNSVVIRAHKPGSRLWVAWLDGKFHSAMVSDEDGARRLSSAQARAYVMNVGG